MNKQIELLAPAGDLLRGMIALDFGANAIYFGAKTYSLRARASNFDISDVKQMTDYAHKLNKRAYLVTNILCHNHMIKNFDQFLNDIKPIGIDGYICSDPYIIQKIKQSTPRTQIHISTQLSVTNSKAALFYQSNGADRIITSREVSLSELAQMIKNVDNKIDIEYFVHGAVCIAYSGRCMLSSNYCLRDANVGGCSQSCRWPCILYDEHQIYAKNFSMSAKDMCLIKSVDKLISANVSSLKIEGRMKSEHYIATVVNAYRHAIDAYYKHQSVNDSIINDVYKAANREVSTGWLRGLPTTNEMLYHDVPKQVNQNYVMLIKTKVSDNTYKVISKNYFSIHDQFEILSRNHDFSLIKIKAMKINNVQSTIVNTPMQEVVITFERNIELLTNDMLRLVK